MQVSPSARPETPVTQMGSFAGMACGRGLQTWPEQVCSARSQFPTLATWSPGFHRRLCASYKKNIDLVSWVTLYCVAKGSVLVVFLIGIEWAQAPPGRVTLEGDTVAPRPRS